MARRPRVHFPGALYHVISRGNQRCIYGWDQTDRSGEVSQKGSEHAVAGSEKTGGASTNRYEAAQTVAGQTSVLGRAKGERDNIKETKPDTYAFTSR